MEQLAAHPDVQLLAGSSMGAFACAVAATRWPDRPLKLLLFAPACGVHRSWARALGEKGIAAWKSEGVLRHFHHGVDAEIEIPYAFWEQCAEYAEVVIRHPTVIVHGLHDDIIPIDEARDLTERSPGVHQLFAVDDSHRLKSSVGAMEEALNCLLSL
jgi:pimeloyl-ACP methyl ester carboxylesterase